MGLLMRWPTAVGEWSAHARGSGLAGIDRDRNAGFGCNTGRLVVATINDPIVAAENAITLNNLIKTAK